MSKRTADAKTTLALRELDPATTTTLSEAEGKRADATLARLMATPAPEHVRGETARPRRRRLRLLIPAAALSATAVIAVPAVLGGGSAFASWSATPTSLSPSSAAAAATTCRSALDISHASMRVGIAEHRGGWTYVLLDGPVGEGVCLMPDELIGDSNDPGPRSGFFGSFNPDPAQAPTPGPKDIIETESAAGAVSLPSYLSLGTVDSWFSWTTGYAGEDVIAVTLHPPVGPDVDASLSEGRYTAWWPAGQARGGNPGVGAGWTYTATLSDGTKRRVEAN